jgi:hypothetical protein
MDQQETDQLVGQLFAVITGLFEDGAGLAMKGQVPRGKDIPRLTAELRTMAQDIGHLLDAAEVALRHVD